MSPAAPVRLLQVTDCHLKASPDGEVKGWMTDRSLTQTLEEALDGEPRPDALLLTGDLAQDGSRPAYARLRERTENLGCPVLCIPGNHDDPQVMASVLSAEPFAYCGDYGFDHWRLVLLSTWDGDRGGGRLSAPELERLSDTLSTRPEPHQLVVLHHHPVPIGSAWLDGVALDNAREFLAVLDASPRVRGVVWGHVHQLHDSQRNGVRLLGTPSSCFQFAPFLDQPALDERGPGWRWIELHPDGRIDTRVQWVGSDA
jgi:Icc protein